MTDDFWGNLTSFHNETITCDYNALVEAFGEPEHYSNDKVQTEWEIDIPGTNDTITIYDWKEYGRNVCDGLPVVWHIGRRKSMDIAVVSDYLATKGFVVKC